MVQGRQVHGSQGLPETRWPLLRLESCDFPDCPFGRGLGRKAIAMVAHRSPRQLNGRALSHVVVRLHLRLGPL